MILAQRTCALAVIFPLLLELPKLYALTGKVAVCNVSQIVSSWTKCEVGEEDRSRLYLASSGIVYLTEVVQSCPSAPIHITCKKKDFLHKHELNGYLTTYANCLGIRSPVAPVINYLLLVDLAELQPPFIDLHKFLLETFFVHVEDLKCDRSLTTNPGRGVGYFHSAGKQHSSSLQINCCGLIERMPSCILIVPMESAKFFLGSNIIDQSILVLRRKRRSTKVVAFIKPKYVESVPEDVDIGTTILTLQATGGSGSYLFKLSSGMTTQVASLFDLDENSGQFKVRQKLDRESGATQFTIDVIAVDKSDPSASALATVVLTIVDVNDNQPLFRKPVYEQVIPEELPPGKLVLTVQATDEDAGSNGYVTYSIVRSGSALCPFDIDRDTGKITVNQILDREKQAIYYISVKAEDGGKPPLSSTVMVNITLSDVNDNDPKFTKPSYTVTIPENTPRGTSIISVEATDADVGTNAEIRYEPLNSRNFRIDSLNGQVILDEPVDFDRNQKEFSFTVVAFDNGTPPNHGTARLTIFVTDVNDNPPKFTRSSMRPTRPIPEDAEIGTTILTVRATDLDSGKNGEVFYSIDSKDAPSLPFKIDAKSGHITLVKLLDYELVRRYQFNVLATDSGTPPLQDTGQVVVEVGNINDNPPAFKNSTYRVGISEVTDPGKEILVVTASDPDELSSSEFEYGIAEGNGDSCFAIDAFTGSITFRGCPLDYKKQKEYKLKLKVVDVDGKTGYAMLYVDVFDANDNAPRFESSVILFNILEDIPVGAVVGTISATDDDDGENARITYSVLQNETAFRLDPDSGAITTTMVLDRETQSSYQFSVKAEDNGKPIRKRGTALVIIKVQDVNDNPPRFMQEKYFASILEGDEKGRMVVIVSAVDQDEGLNKEVRYSFAAGGDGNGAFSIEIDSGIIRTRAALDREQTAKYTLLVVATDQGIYKKLNTTVQVDVDVKDVQDSDPVFEHNVYNFTIPENSLSQVGFVKATLADEEFKQDIVYRISNSPLNLFQINPSTGKIMVSAPLDHEERAAYQIVVRAVSSMGKTDSAVVNIEVLDVNDNKPVMDDFYIFLNTFNEEFNPYFQLQAYDADSSSRLTFTILSGNDEKFVALNSKTGMLTLDKSISNIVNEIELNLEVSDGANRDTAFVRISVSQISMDMVQSSVLIMLADTTLQGFLKASMLAKFKAAIGTAFNCDSRRVYLISVREKMPLRIGDKCLKCDLPALEVAVAVREEKSEKYLSSRQLKDQLYFNLKMFEQNLGIHILSFDADDEFWCSSEGCSNFQSCSIFMKSEGELKASSSSVAFLGIKVQPKSNCSCPVGYQHGANRAVLCGESVNLCYSKPCGDHGKCLQTDGGYTCVCEKGYQGIYCEVNLKEGCPASSSTCGPGTCISNTDSKGFRCTCPDESKVDTPFSCGLNGRFFKKDSFVSMPALQQRFNLSITLEFATEQSNAVLMYNGRYSEERDFIAIHLVDGQAAFSISLGGEVTTVQSYVPGGVDDGKMHYLAVQFGNKMADIAVGQTCDVNSARLLNPHGKKKYCSASSQIAGKYSILQLSAPLHIGGLPEIGRPFRLAKADFIGCIRSIHIDHRLLDLSNPVYNHMSEPKCPSMVASCDQENVCKSSRCVDGIGGFRCECPLDNVGNRCEKDVSTSSTPVTLKDGSLVAIGSVSHDGVLPWTTSVVVRTTKKNAVLLQDSVNGKQGYLKISEGYACYVFDSTFVLNLTSVYIANGKWHEIEIRWEANMLVLLADYSRYKVSAPHTLALKSVTLQQINTSGENAFVGCLKGLFFNGQDISTIRGGNKNVERGCLIESLCASLNPCGSNGTCKDADGVASCECQPGFKGPDCIDICDTKPCQNSGTCEKSNANLAGFVCLCSASFTGAFCETEMKTECSDGYFGTPGTGLCGPCMCDTVNNFDSVCNKTSGQCHCKDEYYLRGSQCVYCDCLWQSSDSLICNKATGQCPCQTGVLGRTCDRCPGSWEEITSHCMEINTSCPKSYSEGVWWNRIRPGTTSQADCPVGAQGNATRYCHPKDSWQQANLFGCTSTGFRSLAVQMGPVFSNDVDLDSSTAVSFASQLEFASLSAARLYGKDVEIGYQVLTKLIAFEANQTSGLALVSSRDHLFVANLLASASRLFSHDVISFWNAIQERSAGTAGLLRELERFLQIVCENLAYVKRRRTRRSLETTLPPYSQASDSIYLEVQPIYIPSQPVFDFPQQLKDHSWLRSWKDKSVIVFMPKEIFEASTHVKANQINVGLIIYKSIGKLLPRTFHNINMGPEAVQVSVISDVVSLNVPGVITLPPASLISIWFYDIQVNSTSQVSCVFWNHSIPSTISGGWSQTGCRTEILNGSKVACFCNHLSTFALVRVIYGEKSHYKYSLSIWTLVSIIVSMVMLLVAFLCYVCLRHLKSNASSIHKNLCVAVFLAELAFVLGIARTDQGETACRVIAILIHYFFSCTFSWMFVEALHMYRMLIERRNINYGQMTFYYFIGWGAPVIVVGVTAGLMPHGYGNPHFCWILLESDRQIMWTFLAPVLAIVGGNFLLFCMALCASFQKLSLKKRELLQMRVGLGISAVLLPFLGVTFVVALMAVNDGSALFHYLFAPFCIAQGLYILLFHVAFNEEVRKESLNAYHRWKTGDMAYGIDKPKIRRAYPPLLGEESYRATLQAFNITTSSNTDSDDTAAARRARIRVAGSESTSFPTTEPPDSSDTSEDDTSGPGRSFRSNRARNGASESSESSDDTTEENGDAHKATGSLVRSPPSARNSTSANPSSNQAPVTEWKVAKERKLKTAPLYASDGPMHSTPSDTESSERAAGKRWPKSSFPSPGVPVELSSIQDEGSGHDVPDNQPSAGVAHQSLQSGRVSSGTSTDSSEKSSQPSVIRLGSNGKPVGILKKKSKYDEQKGRLRVHVKDSVRRPLMTLDDTAEIADSQV